MEFDRNPTLDALCARKSVRVFTEEPVPQAVKNALFQAAMQAPTAGNQMLYTILDITDAALKARLADLCDHQPFIADAPVVLVFVADCQRWYDGFAAAGCAPRPPREGDLLLAAAVALPLFVLAGALGSYFILRRSLRGLDTVNAAAASIGEGRDLSLRIGHVPGGEELTKLAENFDGLLERLQRSFAAERRFTADASHELRTPVAVIKSACEYGRAYDETEEERLETLDTIQRQADRMAGLIGQLLALTRLDQGTEPLRPVPLDLGQLARRAVEEQNYAPSRLRLALAEGVTVRGDEALLGRLVANLADNAFKYGLPGGTVTVEVRAEGGEALLTVADEGPGIPAAQQEKIWQRFYQVDAARSDEQEGVGLGLSLVQRIAQLHGGRMTLESAEGAPSAFTLHLSLAQ